MNQRMVSENSMLVVTRKSNLPTLEKNVDVSFCISFRTITNAHQARAADNKGHTICYSRTYVVYVAHCSRSKCARWIHVHDGASSAQRGLVCVDVAQLLVASARRRWNGKHIF